MNIKLYNTLTRRKEDFHPLDLANIRMYVCGPTVYDTPHIGNARAVVVYDVLYRLLCHTYGVEQVTYVRNITDVDDKINIAARERKIPITHLTAEITEIFHRNMDKLNCLRPNFEPKATEHIKEMIVIIEKLLNQDIAYIAPNDTIYFDITKCKDYGILAGREISELRAGARVEIDDNKRNPEDFILWKPVSPKDDESSIFDSPWVRGRPGWHIECSAMSSKYLGNDFDIHGGGADLMFPHHTNEIAQSCSAFPGSKFARYWVHNGFVTVKGEKMSKSLGNFITVEELLQKNIPGEVIRYVLLATSYQKPLDWNEKNADDAKKILDSWYKITDDQDFQNVKALEDEHILEALADNLNTPKAFAYMIGLAKDIDKCSNQEEKLALLGKFKFASNILGFIEQSNWFAEQSVLSREIEEKINLRQEARRNKNWAEADRIREELKKNNILLEDNADGTINWKRLLQDNR